MNGISFPAPAEIINYLAANCFGSSLEHGFWDDFINSTDPLELYPSAVPVKLALIHSEVSEALESDRAGKDVNEKDGLGEELADVVIRVFDLAAAMQIDIGNHIVNKMATNLGRPKMHGGKKY